MKTICQFTSLPLEVPFLSSPTRIQFYHPIFTLSLKSLLGIYAQWKDKPVSQSPEADVILLTAAFLKASGHCTFQSAINLQSPDLAQRLHQSIESLVSTAILVATKSPKDEDSEIPHFIISKDTASLETLPNWISLWQESLHAMAQTPEHKLGLAARARLESRLSYYIIHQKENAIYIGLLCDWLTEAADLPTEIQIQNPFTKLTCSLASYWCDLLSRAIKGKEIFSLPLNDIQEFYDHCIENLDDVGSSFAHAALSALRKVIHTQTQGFGIDTTFVIMPQTTEQKIVNDATQSLLKAIASKYDSKPERKDFTSQSDYLRASLAYASQNLGRSRDSQSTDPNNQIETRSASNCKDLDSNQDQEKES